jgi:Fe-S cluster assembly iron-binding protein IscA
MIHITPLALTNLTEFLASQKADTTVRVHQASGCGGGADGFLALSIDQPNDLDFTTKAGDLTLIIAKKLMDVTGKVTIDFKTVGGDSGFIVETQNILPVQEPDCGGCSGCFV